MNTHRISAEEMNRVLNLLNQAAGIVEVAATVATDADEHAVAGACEGAATLARQAYALLADVESRSLQPG